ncbi:hypothetical protein G6F24_016978 [Rhizopus arrhizus]|nr:hypothetical protein G6F24_016978 [Rhizopus arrhizus]
MAPSTASRVSRARRAGEHSTQSGSRLFSFSHLPAASASASPTGDSGRSRSAWPGVAGSAWAWRSRISSRIAGFHEEEDAAGKVTPISKFQPRQQGLPIGLVLAHLGRPVVEQAAAEAGHDHVALAVTQLRDHRVGPFGQHLQGLLRACGCAPAGSAPSW